MAPKFKNHNFLITVQEGTSARALTAKIVNFFLKQAKEPIVIITKRKLSTAEANSLSVGLTASEFRLVTLMYCKDYQTVLNKLLEVGTVLSTPKVVIVESLHQWCNSSTPLEKIPSIYSTIFAASQDTINANSRLLGQSCFGFISAKPDELPTNIIGLLYDCPVAGTEDNLDKVLEKLKGQL